MQRVRLLPALLISSLFPHWPVRSQEAGDAFQKFEPAVSRAVDRGFDYLMTRRAAAGEFPESHGRSTGINSLVGMAFLSKGHLPGKGRHGHEVNRCIDYALDHVKRDGLIDSGENGSGPMYAHTISTLFLSEVSGMADAGRQSRIDAVLPTALGIILSAQAVEKTEAHQGGWRYHINSSDSDLSCSGWALMALRSARLNGAPIPDSAITNAVTYVKKNMHRKLGHFGYMDPDQHRDSLTGAGLLCLELCGHHASAESLLAGDWLLAHHTELPRSRFEYYGNYYNAQAMFQLGGTYWRTYCDWMYTTYLEQQQADGAWRDGNFGTIYGTAIMILSFTVPARQLPIYQRDEGTDQDRR